MAARLEDAKTKGLTQTAPVTEGGLRSNTCDRGEDQTIADS